jgi:hypothetical protein
MPEIPDDEAAFPKLIPDPEATFKADQARHDEVISKLRRLDAILEEKMRARGITADDLRKLDLENAPPDVKAALEAAKAKAKKAVEEYKRDASFEPAQRPKAPPSRRPGALKL